MLKKFYTVIQYSSNSRAFNQTDTTIEFETDQDFSSNEVWNEIRKLAEEKFIKNKTWRNDGSKFTDVKSIRRKNLHFSNPFYKIR